MRVEGLGVSLESFRGLVGLVGLRLRVESRGVRGLESFGGLVGLVGLGLRVCTGSRFDSFQFDTWPVG